MVELKQRTLTIASAGALSAGGLAALLGVCCGAPWLVGVIGVTGAVAVACLAFSAPFLWLLALVLSLATLAWSYRAASTCDINRVALGRGGMRFVAWAVVILLIGLFIATRGWSVPALTA